MLLDMLQKDNYFESIDFRDEQSLNISKVEGLQYIPNYINTEQHDWIIDQVYQLDWDTSMRRRVQHYGYRYDYRARKVTKDMHLGIMPMWLNRLCFKLYKSGITKGVLDQVIINEYEPGQGISPHIDCEPCFEDVIISLSLGSGCIMYFTEKNGYTKENIPVYLSPCSVVVLSGKSRYEWLHSISPRKTDMFNNKVYKRSRRVSLTFRRVIL